MHNNDYSFKFSIVLPVFQEEHTIEKVINDVYGIFLTNSDTFEVILINDGSTDGTASVISSLSNVSYPNLKIINHPYNKGNGASIRSGIIASKGEYIICMDADGQHDPTEIGKLTPYLNEFDLIVGARTDEYKSSWNRKLANILYNSFASRLTKFKIEDLTSGFRIFRARVIKKYVHLFPSRFSYPTTSTLAIIKGGYNVKYVSIHVKKRETGLSKISIFKDGSKFLIIIFKISILFDPIRVFFPIVISLFSLGLVSTIVSSLILGRIHIPNSSVLFFLVSIIVLLLSFISEQIAALQTQQTYKE